MQEPLNELRPLPSSPTASSISSFSDLDTESTGSFFHDRSTTLGTLMGVSFPVISFPAPSHQRVLHPPPPVPTGRRNKKAQPPFTPAVVAQCRRRPWWSLCRDNSRRPASLGEFLEIERRFDDVAFYEGASANELQVTAAQLTNRTVLFADGRVLPRGDSDKGTPAAAICRFPVSLTGICSGCVG